jgi:hypothetical protein
MKLHCLTGSHSSDLHLVSNQGFHFSRCKSCGEDLIRSGARWKSVPAGFRIVWKPTQGAMSARVATAANVPMVIAQAAERLRVPTRAWLDRPAFMLAALALAALRLLVRRSMDRFGPAGRAARPVAPLALTYAPA